MDAFETACGQNEPTMIQLHHRRPTTRTCPHCGCREGNRCHTTLGACFWLDGSDLCGACLFPRIRLRGPLVAATTHDLTDSPLTVGALCRDARCGDVDTIRWSWAVYGREVRARYT